MSVFLRLAAVGILVAEILRDSQIWLFLDAASMAIILGVLVASLVAWCSWTDVRLAVRAGLGHDPVTPSEAARHTSVLQTARTTSLAAGFAGMFIGWILMLAYMDDPTTIGPAFAVSLLTSLYAVILAELFFASMINGVVHRASDG